MKLRILEILGKNHQNTIEFIEVEDYHQAHGLYTYRGGVYVLKGGNDVDFDDLTEKEQKNILTIVESKKWKINKALQ